MKYKICFFALILLFFLNSNMYSQEAYVGYLLDHIDQEFPDQNIEIDSFKGHKTFMLQTPNAILICSLVPDFFIDIVYQTVVIPLNPEAHQNFKHFYNRFYRKIEENKWSYQSQSPTLENNVIITIEHDRDFGNIFRHKIQPEMVDYELPKETSIKINDY